MKLKSFSLRLMIVTLGPTIGTTAVADETTDVKATVTLPLEEVLRLRSLDEIREEVSPPPPVAYSVSSFTADARIVGRAIEATAHVSLAVLEDTWTRVPVLHPSNKLHVSYLPEVDAGHFSTTDGDLAFITEKSGTYTFSFRFVVEATRKGADWRANLGFAPSAIQRVRLEHDAALFRVMTTPNRSDGERQIYFGSGDSVALAWRTLRPSKKETKKTSPPVRVEPVVTQGEASVVVTLDGQQITRIQYVLILQGEETLELQIPTGQTLAKIYVDGISRPIQSAGDRVQMTVSPSRLGQQSASLEIVLVATHPPMALSGTIRFAFPKLSWGINEMHCVLHLPEVFNYTWVGGSLSPNDDRYLPSFTYAIPSPGKKLAVSQQLVRKAPGVSIEYAVDLTGYYFQ